MLLGEVLRHDALRGGLGDAGLVQLLSPQVDPGLVEFVLGKAFRELEVILLGLGGYTELRAEGRDLLGCGLVRGEDDLVSADKALGMDVVLGEHRAGFVPVLALNRLEDLLRAKIIGELAAPVRDLVAIAGGGRALSAVLTSE